MKISWRNCHNTNLFKRDDGSELTIAERRIADAQLRTQRELLNSLLSGSDTQIIKLTKLKVAITQWIEALNEIRDAAHRYLFWVPKFVLGAER